MVDRPLPVDPAEAADVLKQYGLDPKTVVAPARSPTESYDAAEVLKGYGIKLKPGQAQQMPSNPEPSYEETFRGDIEARKAYDKMRENAKAGKIPDEPEAVPTREEFQRGLARGVAAQTIGAIPIVGPLANMATAATGPAPVHGEDTFAQRFYDQSQADRAFSMAHPWETAGANLAGGAIGYGGLAKAPFGIGRALMGLSGPTLGARIYQGTAGGAGINALDAALRGDNPASAALVGAAGGVAGPILSEGARGATNVLASQVLPKPGPLKDIPRAGVNLLANALSGETDTSIAAARTRMGPHGFLADINQGLTDIAGGIADMSIPEKRIVLDAYRQRLAQQGPRIDDALTKATGIRGDFDITRYEKFLTESRKAASDPLYQQFRDTKVYPTPELKALVPRLEKVGAFDEAEFLSGATGTPINRNFFTGGPQKAFPTTETWDLVKRGLDSKIEQAYSGGNNTRAKALIGLKNELIGEIENTSAGQVWKQARQEFASRSALLDQLNAGRDTFLGSRSGLSVDEMRDELSHLSQPELAARVVGMRKAVAEAMGDKTEAASSVRNKLLAPNNQEKIRLMLIHQPGAADELIHTLESEKYLSDRAPAILPNMSTGASGQTRADRRKMFEPPNLPSWFENVNVTQPATWIPPGLRPHNVLQAYTNERAAQVAPALASVVTQGQGPRMDALINALRAEGNRQATITEAGRKYLANPLSVAVSGPGQFAYRRHVENQAAQ